MSGKSRILIIDDEPSILDSLRIILRDHGCSVDCSESGIDGLSRFRAGSFDLAITDLTLPDISGLEVLEEIRRQDPTIEVIIITAHFSSTVVRESKRRGALEVLAKPFMPSELVDLVTAALARRFAGRSQRG